MFIEQTIIQILLTIFAILCLGNAFKSDAQNFEKVLCMTASFVFIGLVLLITILKEIILC